MTGPRMQLVQFPLSIIRGLVVLHVIARLHVPLASDEVSYSAGSLIKRKSLKYTHGKEGLTNSEQLLSCINLFCLHCVYNYRDYFI